jgi:tartrate-resistant acid phosphatase type 5
MLKYSPLKMLSLRQLKMLSDFDMPKRILPSFNYTVDVKPKQSPDDLISIMMIDTVIMCGNSPYEGVGDPKFGSIEEKLLADDYFKDFEERLKAIAQTRVPYILVAGHFPVWSIAEHGPTPCLVDKLRPLLHKYNVSAYFSGHDHNLQHIQDTYLGQKVDYIVSGCSNFIDESTQNLPAIPPNSLRFHWAAQSIVVNGGFNLVSATKHNMTVTFYETTGKALYQTIVYPRSFE